MVLLGYRKDDIATHSPAPELTELVEAASRVCEENSGTDGTEAAKKKTSHLPPWTDSSRADVPASSATSVVEPKLPFFRGC